MNEAACIIRLTLPTTLAPRYGEPLPLNEASATHWPASVLDYAESRYVS
ncbi:MAG: hypothetical protein Q7J33_02995 [Serpentinimonas sp.]|nr:hypothetical protein [Serpentinimonas sp.]